MLRSARSEGVSTVSDETTVPAPETPAQDSTQTSTESQSPAAGQISEMSVAPELDVAPPAVLAAVPDERLTEESEKPVVPADSPAEPEAALVEPAPAPEPALVEPTPEPALVEPTPEPAGAPSPTPASPRPAVPSPAALAKIRPAAVPAPVASVAPSQSARFGRVAEDGTVYVTDGDEERAVGSMPGASPEDALQHFARRYDEHAASANALLARAQQPETTSHELLDGLRVLRGQLGDAEVVGDLPTLRTTMTEVDRLARDKARAEQEVRAAARAEATARREEIVAEAERIAATPPERMQWKNSGARMRELLDAWKEAQRTGPKLEKDTETSLWERFSKARNGFDRGRKAYFAELDEVHAHAKQTKTKLIAQAKALSTSTDWGATAGEFRRLMDQWREAGRADRATDEALWAEFKAAQDAFFARKDEVVAAENVEFEANLAVKEGILKEAEALLPVTNIDSTKEKLRVLQERWEQAGKVPRKDMARIESGMRRVESAIRDAEDVKWRSTNPELSARARAMVEQLEAAVAKLTTQRDAAEARGDSNAVSKLTRELEAKQVWLDQARSGLAEFGG